MTNAMKANKEARTVMIIEFKRLAKIHEEKYGHIDISEPKSLEEKKSEKEIALLGSEMNSSVKEYHAMTKALRK